MRGIHDIAAATPGRAAIIEGTLGGDRVVSFGDLERAINRMSHALRGEGVGPSDRVAVMLHNRAEVFVAWNAVVRLGALVVPISFRSAAPELRYLVDDSQAKVLIHDDADLVERASLSLATWHVDDPRFEEGPTTPPTDEYFGSFVTWMSYTSGTTGRPKGIERPPPSPARYPAPDPYMDYWGFGANDVHLLTGPAYHTAPGAYAQMHLVEGATVVVMPRWDAAECLRLIATHGVTNSHMVPANFIRILELSDQARAQHDLSSVRKILHGAAFCPVTVKRRIMDVFPPNTIWEYYGASEGMGTVIAPGDWLEHPGSVGRPFPGLDIEIIDERGNEAPTGEIGTVYLLPAAGYEPRYRNDPEKTEEAYRGRYFTVGDLGRVDADGYLYLADRRTDLILRGGVNVYPAEVESALAEHEAVVDSAVVGLPDERLGQRVHAVVELAPDARCSAEALTVFLRERLADFKVPDSIAFVDRLPREPNGKIRKRLLVATP